jgi:hypothetical protein
LTEPDVNREIHPVRVFLTVFNASGGIGNWDQAKIAEIEFIQGKLLR